MNNSQRLRNTRGMTQKPLEVLVKLLDGKPDVIYHAEIYLDRVGHPILYALYKTEKATVEVEFRYNGNSWKEAQTAYWCKDAPGPNI